MKNTLIATGTTLGAVFAIWLFTWATIGLATLEARLSSCSRNGGIAETNTFFDVTCRGQIKPEGK